MHDASTYLELTNRVKVSVSGFHYSALVTRTPDQSANQRL